MPFDWVTGPAINEFKTIQDRAPLFPKVPQFEFGWWYAYFWKEVKGAGSPDSDFQALIDMIYVEPHVNVGGLGFTARNLARTNAAKIVINNGPNLAAYNDGRKKRILKKMLEMGFRAMPAASMHHAVEDTRDFFKHLIRYQTPGMRGLPASIGFRGEGRPLATVIQHQGARNRVDLNQLNMDAPWHPFSEAALGRQMYFRKTSGDNCLYSVTSVGSELEVSIGFPLIEDTNIYHLPGKPLEKWTKTDWQQTRSPSGEGIKSAVVVKIRVIHEGRLLYGYALGSESSLYVVKIMGDAVHTQNALGGDQCRERGVREIPMRDFMAGVRLRRVHFGPTRCHGIHALVHETKYYVGGPAWADPVTDQEIADFHFDGDVQAAAKFRALMTEQILSPANLVGERTEGPAWKIAEVVKWDVDYEEFKSHAKDPEVVFLPACAN